MMPREECKNRATVCDTVLCLFLKSKGKKISLLLLKIKKEAWSVFRKPNYGALEMKTAKENK